MPYHPKSLKLQLKKGLTRAQALTAAKAKTIRDFRGFTYDAKTGKAVVS